MPPQNDPTRQGRQGHCTEKRLSPKHVPPGALFYNLSHLSYPLTSSKVMGLWKGGKSS